MEGLGICIILYMYKSQCLLVIGVDGLAQMQLLLAGCNCSAMEMFKLLRREISRYSNQACLLRQCVSLQQLLHFAG